MSDGYWFVKEKHYNDVKFCPMCGEKALFFPNDLWEWACRKCGAWFMVR